MFIDATHKMPFAVWRSGTQVDGYPSRIIPLLRTAKEVGLDREL